MKLIIRYANPDTIPSQYGAHGYRSDNVIVDGYWTLSGALRTLQAHVNAALADNNLNDYEFAA